jgi:hypothetical protein
MLPSLPRVLITSYRHPAFLLCLVSHILPYRGIMVGKLQYYFCTFSATILSSLSPVSSLVLCHIYILSTRSIPRLLHLRVFVLSPGSYRSYYAYASTMPLSMPRQKSTLYFSQVATMRYLYTEVQGTGTGTGTDAVRYRPPRASRGAGSGGYPSKARATSPATSRPPWI